jgi:hypothetical protein
MPKKTSVATAVYRIIEVAIKGIASSARSVCRGRPALRGVTDRSDRRVGRPL